MTLRSLSDIVSHLFSSMYPRQMYFIFSPDSVASRELPLFDRCAHLPRKLLSNFLAEFRPECGAEVLSLEQLPNLDLGLPPGRGVGGALVPLDRRVLHTRVPLP